MSRPDNDPKPRRTVVDRPVKPGSVLYRILELVAIKVAERLASKTSATKKGDVQR